MIRFSFLLFNLSGMGRLRRIDFREIGSREKSIKDTHKLVSPSEFSSRVSLADRRNHGEISDPSIEREKSLDGRPPSRYLWHNDSFFFFLHTTVTIIKPRLIVPDQETEVKYETEGTKQNLI